MNRRLPQGEHHPLLFPLPSPPSSTEQHRAPAASAWRLLLVGADARGRERLRGLCARTRLQLVVRSPVRALGDADAGPAPDAIILRLADSQTWQRWQAAEPSSAAGAPVIVWCPAEHHSRALQAMREGAQDWLVDEGIESAGESGGESVGAALRAMVDRVVYRHERQSRERVDAARHISILDHTHDRVCRFRPDWMLTYLNLAYATHGGQPLERLLGSSFLEGIPDQEHGRIAAQLQGLSVDHPTVSLEYIEHTSEGTRCQKHIIAAVFDAAGRAVEYQSTARDTSAHRHAELAANTSQARYQALYEHAPVMMYVVDADGRLQSVNRCWLATLGYAEAEVLGRRSFDFLHEDCRAQALTNLRNLVRHGSISDVPMRFRHRDGRSLHMQFTATTLLDDEGDLQNIVVVAVEVTARLRALDALQAEKERLRTTLASIADAVITTDAYDRVDYLNSVAMHLCGQSMPGAMGQPLGNVFMPLDVQTRRPAPHLLSSWNDGSEPSAAWLHPAGAAARAVEFTVAPIRHDGGPVRGRVLVFRDTTEARALVERMSYQANHDPLTDLLNRRAFEERLQRVLDTFEPDASHVLCFLDLDRFKVINDTCGHESGDRVLCELSGLIRTQLRERDTLARMGGDEFAIVLEHCPRNVAARLADRVRAAVADYRYVRGDRSFSLGVSIGMLELSPGTSVSNALRAADHACYIAKRGGRNRVHACQAGTLVEP